MSWIKSTLCFFLVMLRFGIRLLIIWPSVVWGLLLVAGLMISNVSPSQLATNIVSASASFQALGTAPQGQLYVETCVHEQATGTSTLNNEIIALSPTCGENSVKSVSIEEAAENLMRLASFAYVMSIMMGALGFFFATGQVFPGSAHHRIFATGQKLSASMHHREKGIVASSDPKRSSSTPATMPD